MVKTKFSADIGFYDVVDVWKQFGIVPLEVMTGLNYGELKNIHG